MTIFALADLHLPFGNPEKTMEVFPKWENYTYRIKKAWKEVVKEGDLVVIAGDISWAMSPEKALIDLDWIDELPGDKLILKGNHDYWWPSTTKLRGLLPPSIHFVHNNVFNWKGITFGGTRLWDTKEYSFDEFVEFVENPRASKQPPQDPAKKLEEQEKIFHRELERLKFSLQQLDPKADKRIALTHYPPISASLKPSRASIILEDFGIDLCLFGHLHNIKDNSLPFGKARGVEYLLTSADYLDFKPKPILRI